MPEDAKQIHKPCGNSLNAQKRMEGIMSEFGGFNSGGKDYSEYRAAMGEDYYSGGCGNVGCWVTVLIVLVIFAILNGIS